jgi:hypothetical protein
MASIFEGKQAIYNKLVLETLLMNGELTAWEIAKQIEPQIVKMEGDPYHKSQKIYGVLIRKDGRLDDLRFKNYVFLENNKKYQIDFKGLIALIYDGMLEDEKLALAGKRLIEGWLPAIQKLGSTLGVDSNSFLKDLLVRSKPKIDLECLDEEDFQESLWLSVHDYILERRGENQENKLSWSDVEKIKNTREKKLMLSPILFLYERQEKLRREIMDIEETIRLIEPLLEESRQKTDHRDLDQ